MNALTSKPQKVITNTAVTRYGDLYRLYRIMLHRIAAGFTAEELSFLLGHPKDFMVKAEMLQIPFAEWGYTGDFLYIFDCPVETLEPIQLVPEITLTVEMRKTISDDGLSFEARQVVDADKRLLFRLEEPFVTSRRPEKDERAVRERLGVWFRDGRFDEPEYAAHLYLLLKKRMNDPDVFIRPCWIERWLNDKLRQKKLPKLKRTDEDGLYVYSKIDSSTQS
jgi:hypothetical protein